MNVELPPELVELSRREQRALDRLELMQQQPGAAPGAYFKVEEARAQWIARAWQIARALAELMPPPHPGWVALPASSSIFLNVRARCVHHPEREAAFIVIDRTPSAFCECGNTVALCGARRALDPQRLECALPFGHRGSHVARSGEPW